MRKNLLSTLSLALAALLEAWTLGVLIQSAADPASLEWRPVAFHALGIALGAFGFHLTWPQSQRRNRFALTLFFTALSLPLPLIGLILMGSFRLVLRLRPRHMRNTQYVFGEKPFLTLEKPEDFELQSVRSVLEILSGKDENLRRTAIIGLRSADPKKSLPLLRKAIQDSDEQVRLLAQTQFNRILAKLETAVKRMEAGLPDSTHRAADLVVLAEHYHELVYLAVSSQETESIYLERATQLLTEALDLSPDLTAARFLLLRCQVKIPDIASSKASVQTLLASGFPENSLLPWMAEICFVERDWNTFLKTLRQMDASPSCDSRLADRLAFWLRPANRTEAPA